MDTIISSRSGTTLDKVPSSNNQDCSPKNEQLSNHAHSDLIGVQAKQCHTMCDNAACQGGDSSLEPPLSCDATATQDMHTPPATSDQSQSVVQPIKRKKTTDYKTEPHVYISLRTTNAIKIRITEQANLLNISESEYVRRAVLSALGKGDKLFDETGRKIYIVDEKLRQELNRIGNNINQIAYALNSANVNHDSITLADVFEQLVQITSQIEDVKNGLGKEAGNVF